MRAIRVGVNQRASYLALARLGSRNRLTSKSFMEIRSVDCVWVCLVPSNIHRSYFRIHAMERNSLNRSKVNFLQARSYRTDQDD